MHALCALVADVVLAVSGSAELARTSDGEIEAEAVFLGALRRRDSIAAQVAFEDAFGCHAASSALTGAARTWALMAAQMALKSLLIRQRLLLHHADLRHDRLGLLCSGKFVFCYSLSGG